MGLFGRKDCSICGGKIGLLGNRKLDDGNMCKDCASQLSPFFSDRRRSTVADIQEQLAYREANKHELESFNVTRTLGRRTKVMLDEDQGKFVVSHFSRWREQNPDVLDFSQVTGCQTRIDENRTEIKRKDREGKEVSYNPPRYEFDYDIYVVINVNSPWFNDISFQVNDRSVERGSVEYREAEKQANEIKRALTEVRKEVRESVAAANAPKVAITCSYCGATTIPDERGQCEFCGGALG